jgi:uncharacterized protein YprB with RNaseH-like and TPR domain
MIFADIETTSLNADVGVLVTVGLILPNNNLKIFFADKPEDEKKIIQQTLATLRKFKKEPICIWHTGFDIPFLITRAVKNNVDISEIYEFEFVDLCKFVRENFKLSSNKLDEVSKFLGIQKNLNSTGKNVHELYLRAVEGDKTSKQEIINHCCDDLKALKAVFERVKPYVEKWRLCNCKKNF